jgi:hypothetical protein
MVAAGDLTRPRACAQVGIAAAATVPIAVRPTLTPASAYPVRNGSLPSADPSRPRRRIGAGISAAPTRISANAATRTPTTRASSDDLERTRAPPGRVLRQGPTKARPTSSMTSWSTCWKSCSRALRRRSPNAASVRRSSTSAAGSSSRWPKASRAWSGRPPGARSERSWLRPIPGHRSGATGQHPESTEHHPGQPASDET